MAEQDDDANGDTFELLSLLRRLESKAATGLHLRNCNDPVDCGHDVAIDLLQIHGKFIGDKIVLVHRVAQKQLPFLYHCLKYAISKKKKQCKACKPGTVLMNETPEPNDPSNSIGPQSPDDLCDKVELMERVLSHIKDPQRRTAFRKHVFEGETCKAIAEELKVSHDCVRQWISRDMARLRKQFPNIESLWRVFNTPGQGSQGRLHEGFPPDVRLFWTATAFSTTNQPLQLTINQGERKRACLLLL